MGTPLILALSPIIPWLAIASYSHGISLTGDVAGRRALTRPADVNVSHKNLRFGQALHGH
jgi:hypothetical protein